MTRIVIVEDEADIASVVQDYLRHAGYETTHFADGQSALESIVAAPPDLTLLDIMLPRLDGIEVLRRAREHTAHPIIMLTARIEEVDRLLGLELGADDYVCKPFSPRELVARIKVLVRRQMPGKANDIACGDLRYDLRTRQFALAGEELALPPRERTLLETLMLKAGSTVSKQALIDAIFGLDDEPSADAVDIYIHRLRKKLEASQATIITLRGVGYLLRTRQEE